MFTFVSIIILALCLQVQNPNWPPMKNYQCKKCGILIKTERQPNAFNCRAGNYHDWNDLGEFSSKARAPHLLLDALLEATTIGKIYVR